MQHKHTGRHLNKAFQKAFNVAKQIRTETNIQRGSVSVGSVAVELAEKIFSSLDQHQVMVIGAGETSEKTARALLSRGAHSIIVSNRSHERAVALARELGGRAVHFEDWAAEFPGHRHRHQQHRRAALHSGPRQAGAADEAAPQPAAAAD